MLEKIGRRIGRGAFCSAHECKDDPSVVYLKVPDMEVQDYSKEILMMLNRHNRSRHIPPMVRVAKLHDYTTVFKSKRYKMPLRKKDSEEAWRIFRLLQKTTEEVNLLFLNRYTQEQNRKHNPRWVRIDGQTFGNTPPPVFNGHQVIRRVIERTRKDLPKSVVRALELLRDFAALHGEEYTFEFAARNLSVDSRGHIVFVDVLFNKKAMEIKLQKQRKAALRREGLRWY